MHCVYSFRIFYFVLLVEFIVISNADSINSGNEIRKFHKVRGFQTTEDLILEAGYQAETYHVQTGDGFELTFFRILPNFTQYNNHEERIQNRPVVVLQHGMFCSSSDWVFAGPKRGLGFILTNLGYDVWLTNVRGNIYGRNSSHAPLLSSFHEMGKYDLPAQIDYILYKAHANKLYYIGYSLGTTAFYVMTSIRPDYNLKVKGMISLAPISFLKHVRGLLIHLIKYSRIFITTLLDLFKVQIVFPHPMTYNNKNICDYPIIGKICLFIISSLCGFNSGQYDKEMVSKYLAITPVGTPWKVAQHYFQLMESGTFRQYDYKPLINIFMYGQDKPPNYNLQNVKVPIIMIQGRNDYLSVSEDADTLIKQLGSFIVVRQYVDNPKFTHADFMWAKDINTLLHKKIIRALELFGRKHDDENI